VILVAHSMGGIPAALAADIFSCKISAVVFLAAFMPDTRNPPAYVFEKVHIKNMMLLLHGMIAFE